MYRDLKNVNPPLNRPTGMRWLEKSITSAFKMLLCKYFTVFCIFTPETKSPKSGRRLWSSASRVHALGRPWSSGHSPEHQSEPRPSDEESKTSGGRWICRCQRRTSDSDEWFLYSRTKIRRQIWAFKFSRSGCFDWLLSSWMTLHWRLLYTHKSIKIHLLF